MFSCGSGLVKGFFGTILSLFFECSTWNTSCYQLLKNAWPETQAIAIWHPLRRGAIDQSRYWPGPAGGRICFWHLSWMGGNCLFKKIWNSSHLLSLCFGAQHISVIWNLLRRAKNLQSWDVLTSLRNPRGIISGGESQLGVGSQLMVRWLQQKQQTPNLVEKWWKDQDASCGLVSKLKILKVFNVVSSSQGSKLHYSEVNWESQHPWPLLSNMSFNLFFKPQELDDQLPTKMIFF